MSSPAHKPRLCPALRVAVFLAGVAAASALPAAAQEGPIVIRSGGSSLHQAAAPAPSAGAPVTIVQPGTLGPPDDGESSQPRAGSYRREASRGGERSRAWSYHPHQPAREQTRHAALAVRSAPVVQAVSHAGPQNDDQPDAPVLTFQPAPVPTWTAQARTAAYKAPASSSSILQWLPAGAATPLLGRVAGSDWYAIPAGENPAFIFIRGSLVAPTDTCPITPSVPAAPAVPASPSALAHHQSGY